MSNPQSIPEVIRTIPRRPPPFVVPATRKPWVMFAILTANVSVFVVKTIYGREGDEWVLNHLAHDKFAVAQGELWRLWTSTYLHPVWIHLGFNMLVHFQMGSVIERVLGHWRYFVLYTLSGLGGALLFQSAGASGEGMGASGAIYGVAGAYVLIALARTPEGDIRPNLKLMGMCAFFVVGDQVFAYAWEQANGVLQIALSAHFGGLVSGLLLGYALVPRPAGVAPSASRRRCVAGAIFGLLAVGTGLYGIVILEHPENLPRSLQRVLVERAKLEALEKEIKAEKFEAAVDLWRSLDLGDEAASRSVGYGLFDDLMAVGKQPLAQEVLNTLIASAEAELVARSRVKSKDPKHAPTHELFNEIAWLHALRGTSLDAALQFVDEAIALLNAERTGVWRFLPRSRESLLRESMYVNTRGWLHLRRGDVREAIADLEAAAKLMPLGANFLYLALAHDRLGNAKAVKEAGRSADSCRDQLSPYETKLLEELRDSLGGF